MKRIILCLSLFAFFGSQAQQINPVPDYVFSNKMSVGRNAVTDTAAYFSIGPRYGAIRGFMPPMVTDTASVTGVKRNGLTIFSIQKNKYLYWDSVRVQWSDFAGSSGAYIFATDTATMLNPYIRAAGYGLTKSSQSLLVDTAAIATRARVQKAVDSINGNVALKVNISDTASMLNPYTRGSGTTNYVPKFTGARTLGNSVAYDNGGTELLVNTTSDNGNYAIQVAGSIYNTTGAVLAAGSGSVLIGTTVNNAKLFVQEINDSDFELARFDRINTALTDASRLQIFASPTDNTATIRVGGTNNTSLVFQTSTTEVMRMTSGSELLIGTTTDAGAYALQVSGAIYNTTTLTTGAPTSGSAKPWRLGEAATVSPTSPNRTIRVEIDGTVYYIHAKTTND